MIRTDCVDRQSCRNVMHSREKRKKEKINGECDMQNDISLSICYLVTPMSVLFLMLWKVVCVCGRADQRGTWSTFINQPYLQLMLLTLTYQSFDHYSV